jgi:hypothetical protein
MNYVGIVDAVFKRIGNRKRRRAAKYKMQAAIIANNQQVREQLRDARAAKGSVESGFIASGAELGSSAFQASRGATQGVAASNVAQNRQVTALQQRAFRAETGADKIDKQGAVFGAVGNFIGNYNKTFGKGDKAQTPSGAVSNLNVTAQASNTTASTFGGFDDSFSSAAATNLSNGAQSDFSLGDFDIGN